MSALGQKRTSELNPGCPLCAKSRLMHRSNPRPPLEHLRAASDLIFQLDRANAIPLLKALVAAGMDTRAPRANAWIEKKALEIGLEGTQFVSALAYAGNGGWYRVIAERQKRVVVAPTR